MASHFLHEPLVIVEGFLSTTSAIFWGKFERFLNASSKAENRRILFTTVGPVSSLHDRACELYYEIKGGRVDYGESHANEYAHERYGREYKTGLYPAWSVERPLHFLGHSMGGPTITKLMELMRDGFFGNKAQPDMVLSVTSVSAPFRGTQIVYTFGEKVNNAPAVRPISVGSLISRAVHTLAYFSPFLPSFPFDLHADSRSLTYHQSSFSSYLRQMWRSDWAEGCDAAPYDCTFAAADEREARGEGIPNPRTWYRSHASSATVPQKAVSENTARHGPNPSSLFSPFYIPALLAGSFDFSTLDPSPSWFRTHKGRSNSTPSWDPLDVAECGGQVGESLSWSRRKDHLQVNPALGEEYWANDGIVPLFSQWHPLSCSPSHCIHINTSEDREKDLLPGARVPVPGVWHVHQQPGITHHITLVPLWFGTRRQRKFWTDLGIWLELVENERSERISPEMKDSDSVCGLGWN